MKIDFDTIGDWATLAIGISLALCCLFGTIIIGITAVRMMVGL